MMRSSDDLPAPFAPRTPILAPGNIEMLMRLSTSRSGGWNRRRSRMVKMNCAGMGATLLLRRSSRSRHARRPNLHERGAGRGAPVTTTLAAVDVVERFLSCMTGHDWDGLGACVTDDVVRVGPYGDTFRGRDAYMAFVSGLLPK